MSTDFEVCRSCNDQERCYRLFRYFSGSLEWFAAGDEQSVRRDREESVDTPKQMDITAQEAKHELDSFGCQFDLEVVKKVLVDIIAGRSMATLQEDWGEK